MIDFIRQILIDEKIILPSASINLNIYFIRSCFVHVFNNNEFLFVIKVGDLIAIKSEYNRTLDARAAVPDLVPEPLVFRQRGEQGVAIWRAVANDKLLTSWPERQAVTVRKGLAYYFEQSLIHLRIDNPSEPHSVRLHRTAETLQRYVPALSSVLDEERLSGPTLGDLPHVWQHGDFWPGNMGLSTDGLIVFDWEDYGRSTLYGFDLAVFCASVLQFDADGFVNLCLHGRPGFLGQILSDFCSFSGLDPAAFFDLLPAYLIEFLQIKIERDYGSTAIQLVTRLLTNLSRS